MGGVSMGIAGSIVDQPFFESYLGMRVETIDMTEFLRRMDQGIFDQAEYKKALKWTKENCREGKDYNSPKTTRSRAQLDSEWEISVKMALIARDLMVGNPKLARNGFRRGSARPQRHRRPVSRASASGRTASPTAISWRRFSTRRSTGTASARLTSSPRKTIRSTALRMLFGYLLTNTAQIFADVRTYWSPDGGQAGAGPQTCRRGGGRILHLINSGPAALDGTGEQSVDGKPAMKPFWEITKDEAQKCLAATTWHPSITEYFPGGGWSTRLSHPRRNAGDDVPAESGQRARPGPANCRRRNH